MTSSTLHQSEIELKAMHHPEKVTRQQEEAHEEAEHLHEDDCQRYMQDIAHAMEASNIRIIDPLSDL